MVKFPRNRFSVYQNPNTTLFLTSIINNKLVSTPLQYEVVDRGSHYKPNKPHAAKTIAAFTTLQEANELLERLERNKVKITALQAA